MRYSIPKLLLSLTFLEIAQNLKGLFVFLSSELVHSVNAHSDDAYIQ